MLSVLWIADAWKSTISTKKQSIQDLFIPAAITGIICLIEMWQIGWIGVASDPSAGTDFGVYSFNLNGFFNPLRQDSFLRSFPLNKGREHEGYAYLGAGVILLCLFVVFLRMLKVERDAPISISPLRPLAVALIGVLLFAMSSSIAIGSYEFILFNANSIQRLQIFRSSGRFIWPLWYTIVILLITENDLVNLAVYPLADNHIFTKLDGLYLLLPKWKDKPHQNIWESFALWQTIPEVELNKKLLTAKNGEGLQYLDTGWSNKEDGGIWNDGVKATMVFRVKDRMPQTVSLALLPFLTERVPAQEMEVWVNGIQGATVALTKDAIVDIDVNNAMQGQDSTMRCLLIVLKFKNAVSPSSLGINEDQRKLAVFLKSITVH